MSALAAPRPVVRLALVLAAVGLAVWAMQSAGLRLWVADHQRAFQSHIAGAIRAIQSGDAGGWLALLGAAGAYGVVHAAGPGHGKFLLGGVGLATQVSARRLVGLAVASSLAQSLVAIALVYGGFALLSLPARRMEAMTRDILTPASYLAIAAVGAVLLWRGLRSAPGAHGRAHGHEHGHGHGQDHAHGPNHDHHHHHDSCGCGHAHGPTPEQAAQVTSVREAAALIGSIAIRPCTGALFLLVIAWQLDLRLAGAAAALTMGLGTALITSAVALSSVAARSAALAGRTQGLATAARALQITGGAVVMWLALTLLVASV